MSEHGKQVRNQYGKYHKDMSVCLMQCGKETCKEINRLRSGDDWYHCNGYLMVSTVVFIVVKYIALTMLVLWWLVEEACFRAGFLPWLSGLTHY